MSSAPPPRPRSTLLSILLLWIAFYASFTLFTPPLLDDADSVHAEVAREMLLRHDYVTLYANGIRYLEKAPLLYWSMAASMRVSQLLGLTSPQALTVAARIPLSLAVLALGGFLPAALAQAPEPAVPVVRSKYDASAPATPTRTSSSWISRKAMIPKWGRRGSISRSASASA